MAVNEHTFISYTCTAHKNKLRLHLVGKIEMDRTSAWEWKIQSIVVLCLL